MLRGRDSFRTQSFVVVTTLLDPIAYPPDELAKLYLRRWAVELFFRPERAEPRVRKRRPKAYPLMTQPRRQYHLAWTSQIVLKSVPFPSDVISCPFS